MILASYHEATAQATYIEENGAYHQYDVSGFSAQHNGDAIPLYYEENVAATLFCSWRLWRIYTRQ